MQQAQPKVRVLASAAEVQTYVLLTSESEKPRTLGCTYLNFLNMHGNLRQNGYSLHHIGRYLVEQSVFPEGTVQYIDDQTQIYVEKGCVRKQAIRVLADTKEDLEFLLGKLMHTEEAFH